MRTIRSIQSLRAIAALGVVFVHVSFEVGGYESRPSIGDAGAIGQVGVDIFFVISGFIMFMMTTEREMTPTEFLFDRLTRIWPLYAMCTLALLLLAIAGRSMQPPSAIDLIKSLAFVPSNSKGMPFLNVGWTLNYEMFFYAVFAASMLLGRFRVVYLAAALLLLAAIGILVSPENAALKTYTSPMLVEFLCGIGVGVAWHSNWRLPAWAGATLVLAGVSCIGWMWQPDFSNLERLIYAGLPSAAIVAGALSLEETRISKTEIGVLLGAASYSIYLTHPLTLMILGRIWKIIGVPNAILLFAVSVLLTTAAGIGFHFWVERPVTALVRSRLFKRPRKLSQSPDTPEPASSAAPVLSSPVQIPAPSA